MKSNLFILCLYIYREHCYADEKLKHKILDVINYEFSPEPFKTSGACFIGLKKHIQNKQVYFNSAWKKCYEILTNLNLLKEDENWGGHYQVLNFDFEKVFNIEYEEDYQQPNLKNTKKIKNEKTKETKTRKKNKKE